MSVARPPGGGGKSTSTRQSSLGEAGGSSLPPARAGPLRPGETTRPPADPFKLVKVDATVLAKTAKQTIDAVERQKQLKSEIEVVRREDTDANWESVRGGGRSPIFIIRFISRYTVRNFYTHAGTYEVPDPISVTGCLEQ